VKIKVYTDGGAIPNPGKAGWAAMFTVDDIEKKVISGHIKHATNNEAEITAAIRAIETFTRPTAFTIISDSQYLIKSMTEWIPKRGHRGYANADLFEKLIAACKDHTITWQWVRGHAGNRFNEMADNAASARIFDGAACDGCGGEYDATYTDFNWKTREIICGRCGETVPMSDVVS